MPTKTYWHLIHCRWVKVTTSIDVWARLPHVTKISVACLATGLAFGPSTPAVPVQPTIPGFGQPAPGSAGGGLDDGGLDDGGWTYIPGLEDGGFAFAPTQTIPTGGGYAPAAPSSKPSDGDTLPQIITTSSLPVGPAKPGQPSRPDDPGNPAPVPEPDTLWVVVLAGLWLVRLHARRRQSRYMAASSGR